MDDMYGGLPQRTTGNNIGGIINPIAGSSGAETKLHTDTYQVFVNGDKVGNKEQLTQVEDANDLKPYLKDNGFENFDYRVVGGHIEIDAKEDSHHMKEILSSYLSIS